MFNSLSIQYVLLQTTVQDVTAGSSDLHQRYLWTTLCTSAAWPPSSWGPISCCVLPQCRTPLPHCHLHPLLCRRVCSYLACKLSNTDSKENCFDWNLKIVFLHPKRINFGSKDIILALQLRFTVKTHGTITLYCYTFWTNRILVPCMAAGKYFFYNGVSYLVTTSRLSLICYTDHNKRRCRLVEAGYQLYQSSHISFLGIKLYIFIGD